MSREQIRESLQQNKAFGGENFIKKMEKRFDNVFKDRKKGRPVKKK